MLRFGFYNKLTAKNMMEDLINYCDNYKNFGKNTSFVAFEEPAPIQSIEVYREKFWSILKDLRMLDDREWPKHIPKNMDDPLWEFCFHGEPMFIVCNTPSHINRISRKSSTFMLTFQPRWIFLICSIQNKKQKMHSPL
ncbi:YqcI/YcgG family protein [Bartonella grahamii]|uniref:YqcI/YcgG family protein n=1 Tax=Bartonella grahamii TaxID=33045 RepID=UPI002E7B0365|nr:YqcI/YcgG family protein [Bartonella grahamii]